MNETDEDRYEAFMTLHAGELRAKAEAAAGTGCPSCNETLQMESVLPWLICTNNHRIRPWTQDELDAMDRSANVAITEALPTALAEKIEHNRQHPENRKDRPMRLDH